MKQSSAQQIEFDYFYPESSPSPGNVGRAPQKRENSPATAGALDITPFDRYGGAVAASARIAGRINASGASPEHHAELLRDRQRLLDRLFDGSITQKERNKLEYVRWSLDRIEDAKHGEVLERLESAIARYEDVAREIRGLNAQLDAYVENAKVDYGLERHDGSWIDFVGCTLRCPHAELI